jgi:hypothetical protein
MAEGKTKRRDPSSKIWYALLWVPSVSNRGFDWQKRLSPSPSIAVRVEDKSILLFQARRVAHPSSLNPRRAKAGHVFYLLLWICQVIHRYLGKPRQSQCRINLLYLLKSLTPRKGTGFIFQVSPFLFQ